MNPRKLVEQKIIMTQENDTIPSDDIDTSNSTQNTASSSTSGKLTQSDNSAFEEATSVETTMLSKVTDKSLSHGNSSDHVPNITSQPSSSQVSELFHFFVLMIPLFFANQLLCAKHDIYKIMF